MSMGREWIAEHEYDFFDIQGVIEDKAKHGVWVMRGGREIPVEDMTTRHIENTMAYIQRTDQYDLFEPWLKVFEAELKRRKER